MVQFYVLILVMLVIYFGLGAGLVFSTISIEELLPGKKYFYFFKKIVLFVLEVLFLSLFLRFNFGFFVAVVLGLALIKVKFSYQIIYGVIPFMLFILKNTVMYLSVMSSLFFILSLVIASEICTEFVSKKYSRELVLSKKEILIKIINKTNLFWISFIIVLLLSAFI